MTPGEGAIPVAVVHGVAFGPSTFARVERELRAAGPVVLVERRGYGSREALAPPASVEEHVDDLLAALDAAGLERAVVAGVSGGATVALAAALIVADRVAAVVAHEPAVGSVSPELLALIAEPVRRGGGRALARTLAGPAWERLDAAEAERIDARAALHEADARAYLAWEPPFEELLAPAPITTTVGERSPAVRHTVARRLEERAGARVVVLPRCGHLAQLDAPQAFARAVAAVRDHASSAHARIEEPIP